MGGYGSGRHGFQPRKFTVEECLAVSIDHLTREGLFDPEQAQEAQFVGGPANEVYRLAVYAYPFDADPSVDLWWKNCWDRHEPGVGVELTRSPMPRGRWRWNFVCPLVTDGVPCGRRVRSLYLPPGGCCLGCRHCHGLTYQSSQGLPAVMRKIEDACRLGRPPDCRRAIDRWERLPDGYDQIPADEAVVGEILDRRALRQRRRAKKGWL